MIAFHASQSSQSASRISPQLRCGSGPIPEVAGVDPVRVMGHVIGGVRQTYDRYEYLEEKRDALAKLSAIVGEIVSPP
jgi:hypothetical protein